MWAPAAMPSPDSTMQPSMTPRPRARAAWTMRTASRIPPDLASLTLIPWARSAQGCDVGEGVAVLVDVDRDRRAALQLGAAGVAGRERLLAVLERHLRQELECLLERPVLVDVDLQRQVGGGADCPDAVEVEPVLPPELELEPLEAAPLGRLGAAGHVVGVAEPDRPRGRRAGAAEAEEPVDGDARELSLQVVERRVEGRAGRILAGRERGLDLVERPGIVTEGDPFEPGERRIRRFARSGRSARPRRIRHGRRGATRPGRPLRRPATSARS